MAKTGSLEEERENVMRVVDEFIRTWVEKIDGDRTEELATFSGKLVSLGVLYFLTAAADVQCFPCERQIIINILGYTKKQVEDFVERH